MQSSHYTVCPVGNEESGGGEAALPASEIDDQDIFDNIHSRIHGPISGFTKKYFGNFQYIHQDAFLEIQAAGKVNGR